jgi:hypothetical protein
MAPQMAIIIKVLGTVMGATPPPPGAIGENE